MARSKKYEKNLSKVQDMLDGNYNNKIQVGMHTPENIHANRKVGDTWTDSDGKMWEQKEGYRSSIKNTPDVGLFSKVCKDCDKNCDNTKMDKDTHIRMGRCYYCQIDFEVDLKSKGKWEEWVMDQETQRWEAVLKEMADLEKQNSENNPYDKSLANALANSEVKVTIKKNL